jgi:hypothetical protein
MADLAGFGRASSPSEVPTSTITTSLPEAVRPGRPVGTPVMGSEATPPSYPTSYPTGPDGVKGDIE